MKYVKNTFENHKKYLEGEIEFHEKIIQGITKQLNETLEVLTGYKGKLKEVNCFLNEINEKEINNS